MCIKERRRTNKGGFRNAKLKEPSIVHPLTKFKTGTTSDIIESEGAKRGALIMY